MLHGTIGNGDFKRNRLLQDCLQNAFTNYGEQGLFDRRFILQSLTSGYRGLPIQDDKRPTTGMGGDFLEKKGFITPCSEARVLIAE